MDSFPTIIVDFDFKTMSKERTLETVVLEDFDVVRSKLTTRYLVET